MVDKSYSPKYASDSRSIKEAKAELIISSFLKLLIMPLCMFIIGRFFGLDKLLFSIVLIFAAMPTAPSSFVLARQLGGDIKLMASIITLQTIFSIIHSLYFLDCYKSLSFLFQELFLTI